MEFLPRSRIGGIEAKELIFTNPGTQGQGSKDITLKKTSDFTKWFSRTEFTKTIRNIRKKMTQ